MMRYQEVQDDEDHKKELEIYRPLATHYIDRVCKRVDRILGGDQIGHMVDSDLEDLNVDAEFERIRQLIEVASSSEHSEHEQQEAVPPMWEQRWESDELAEEQNDEEEEKPGGDFVYYKDSPPVPSPQTTPARPKILRQAARSRESGQGNKGEGVHWLDFGRPEPKPEMIEIGIQPSEPEEMHFDEQNHIFEIQIMPEAKPNASVHRAPTSNSAGLTGERTMQKEEAPIIQSFRHVADVQGASAPGAESGDHQRIAGESDGQLGKTYSRSQVGKSSGSSTQLIEAQQVQRIQEDSTDYLAEGRISFKVSEPHRSVKSMMSVAQSSKTRSRKSRQSPPGSKGASPEHSPVELPQSTPLDIEQMRPFSLEGGQNVRQEEELTPQLVLQQSAYEINQTHFHVAEAWANLREEEERIAGKKGSAATQVYPEMTSNSIFSPQVDEKVRSLTSDHVEHQLEAAQHQEENEQVVASLCNAESINLSPDLGESQPAFVFNEDLIEEQVSEVQEMTSSKRIPTGHSANRELEPPLSQEERFHCDIGNNTIEETGELSDHVQLPNPDNRPLGLDQALAS